MFGRESAFNPGETSKARPVEDPRLRAGTLSGEQAAKYQANLYTSWQEATGLLLTAPLDQRTVNELETSGKTILEPGEYPLNATPEGFRLEVQQNHLQDLANIVTRVTLRPVDNESDVKQDGLDIIYLVSNAENGATTNLAQFLSRDIGIVTTVSDSISKLREEGDKSQFFGRFLWDGNYNYGIPMQAIILALETIMAEDLAVLIHEIGHAIDYQQADAERRAMMDIGAQLELGEYDRTAPIREIVDAHIASERIAWANALKLIKRFEQQGIITDSNFLPNSVAQMNEALQGYADHVAKTHDRTALYTSHMRARQRRMESRILKEWDQINNQSNH